MRSVLERAGPAFATVGLAMFILASGYAFHRVLITDQQPEITVSHTKQIGTGQVDVMTAACGKAFCASAQPAMKAAASPYGLEDEQLVGLILLYSAEWTQN